MEGLVSRKPLADKGVQTSVRLARDLYDRLTTAAGDKGIGEEIRQRLEASFSPGTAELDNPLFRGLLAGIRGAAAAAAKLHPLPEGMREDEHGNRVPYEGTEMGPDQSAYVAFRQAVMILLDAFEPQGIRAVSDQTLIRLSDQLAGVAFGALGDRGLLAFASLADEAKLID